MKKILLPILCGVLGLALSARASTELDKSYGLRSFVAVVINPEQDPVFCEHVENEIVRYFRSRPRFEFSGDQYIPFRDEVRAIYLRDGKVGTQDKVEWIRPQLQALREKGVDAAIIAEVFHFPGQYRVSFVMVSTNDLEYIQFKDYVVEDHQSMESFTQTVHLALETLEKKIPFDGTVVRRDGFRVVLDRGFPDLRTGEEITIYTVEKREEEVVLEETGLVKVTETGDQISFGNIVVEKKPKEVSTYNKILLNSGDINREIAFARDEVKSTKELGEVGLLVGGTIVSVSNAGPGGNGLNQSKFYPGGAIRGEMFLTTRTFINLGLEFGSGTLASGVGKQGSSVNDFRISAGYTLGFARTDSWVPTMKIRVGYNRHAFQADQSTDPLYYSSTSFSGILAGGGVNFKITDRWNAGFDVNTLLFPGASESPSVSGAITSVTGWDFNLYATYHFNDSMDIISRLAFSGYGAEFDGNGTRTIPITSATQSGQSLTFGVSYFF